MNAEGGGQQNAYVVARRYGGEERCVMAPPRVVDRKERQASGAGESER